MTFVLELVVPQAFSSLHVPEFLLLSGPLHFKQECGKECWARTHVWALVSALPLTGCVTLGKSHPSLGPSLHIYENRGLYQMCLKVLPVLMF